VSEVVVNSTPIIALAKIGRLDLLRLLYGTVHIPRAVLEEVTAKDDAASEALSPVPGWVLVGDAPTPDSSSLLRARLHAGEVEAIMLARGIGAEYVLLDDNAAKKTARYLGMGVMGTLGVLVAAKRAGLVDEVAPIVDELRAIGFYVSERVAGMALDAAGEGPAAWRAAGAVPTEARERERASDEA
jgi:predicted nucleic acid-binding protein